MDGSLFPLDLYLLLLKKYLCPYDAFVFSLTCKKLYAIFNPIERLWLLCNERPALKQPVPRDQLFLADYVSCRACRVAMKATTIIEHKCNLRVLAAREEMTLCDQCFGVVLKRRLKKHQESGKCMPKDDGVCHECYGDAHGIFSWDKCKAKKTRCQNFIDSGIGYRNQCLNIIYWGRVFPCSVCQNFYLRRDCKECQIQHHNWHRCSQHLPLRCRACRAYYEKIHVCENVVDRVWLAFQKRHANLPRFSLRGNGLLKCADYYYLLPVPSHREIPSLEAFQVTLPIGVVYDDVNAREIFTMYEPGAFYIPHFAPKEIYVRRQFCQWCGTTQGPMLKCGGCSAACYCSKKCQASHWKWHKLECLE